MSMLEPEDIAEWEEKRNFSHKTCEHYVPENDMCLQFYQLGFHNVSRYGKCLEKVIYDD